MRLVPTTGRRSGAPSPSVGDEVLALGAAVALELLNPPLLAVAVGGPLLAAVLGPRFPPPVGRLLRVVAETSPLRISASG